MATLSPNPFEAARAAMVASQLRTSAVSDARVVAAMAAIPREDYLPGHDAAVAYRDTPVALGGGRMQNLPLATARLINQAEITPGDRVLLIGATTGYTAAVIARLAGAVVAVESEPALAAAARAAGIDVVEGALDAGAADRAPFDVLMIDGAVEEVPAALVAQLRPGGRVVTGLVQRGVVRLAAGVRSGGGFTLEPFADIDCVVLPGFARPRGFHFPG